MTDIYRPLYVLVEAVEAEIKRLLPPERPPVPVYSGPTAKDYENGIRAAFQDNSINIQRAAWDTVMIVTHECSVCGDIHMTRVREELSPTKHAFVEKLVNATKSLLEKPCNIELRKA
jgi:hypothetical protein